MIQKTLNYQLKLLSQTTKTNQFIYKTMKLKRTRRERTCHECKKKIIKGDSYGQKSITLGSKQDGQAETFDGSAIIVHQMRIKVDICQECAA